MKKYKEALAPAFLWPTLSFGQAALATDQPPPPPPAPAGRTSQLTGYFLGVGKQ